MLGARKKLSVASGSGFGYQIDGQGLVNIHPISSEQHIVSVVTFIGVSRGHHEVELGLADSSGKLVNQNKLCFDVPNVITWSR